MTADSIRNPEKKLAYRQRKNRRRDEARYRDPEKRRAWQSRHNLARKRASVAFVWEWKRTHPCVDCGEADPVVLDFDHRDRKTKFKTLNIMSHRGASIETIKTEIAKCDIRCANCHRRKTFIENLL